MARGLGCIPSWLNGALLLIDSGLSNFLRRDYHGRRFDFSKQPQ
jgi:hypothetical protein